MAQAYFDKRCSLGFPMADASIREEVETELKKQADKKKGKQ